MAFGSCAPVAEATAAASWLAPATARLMVVLAPWKAPERPESAEMLLIAGPTVSKPSRCGCDPVPRPRAADLTYRLRKQRNETYLLGWHMKPPRLRASISIVSP